MLNVANILDYFIVTVMMISVLMGLARGLLKEIFSLIVWSAAIIAAVLYCKPASMFLKNTIPDVNIDLIISFILIMFIILMIGGTITNYLQKFLNKSNFSVIDRLTGFLFGGIRAIAIISLAMVLLKASNIIPEYNIKNHKLINYFTPIAAWLDKKLPEDFKHIKIPTIVPETSTTLPTNNEHHQDGASNAILHHENQDHPQPQNNENKLSEKPEKESNVHQTKHKK